MSNTVNKVILIGRLGKDPETKITTNDTKVCHFSLATDEVYKDKNGDKQTSTEWHNIVVWRKLAEICEKYLKKGKLVYIEGRIQTRSWEQESDQGPIKRQRTEITAHEMRMLSKDDSSTPSESGDALVF